MPTLIGRRGLISLMLLVLLAIVGIIGLLIIQDGGSSNGDRAVEAEVDDDPGLPGRFVDIADVYGPYPESGGHVSVPVDYEANGNSNPPVGGPHWSGNCGEEPNEAPPICGPAPWGISLDSWAAETLVHNMEHGGVVVRYNTNDDAIIDELTALVLGHLEDGKLIVIAPYSDMEEEQIAITSWTRIDKFPVSDFDAERVEEFINQHERRFNPEGF